MSGIEPTVSNLQFTVNIQGIRTKVAGRSIKQSRRIGGLRNSIDGFSPASRRRLTGWFTRLRQEAILNSWFCTLTYPDEALPTGSGLKRDLDTLFKRLDRRFSGFCTIWKAELNPRKSGLYKGHFVPHLHLCIVAHPNSDIQEFGEWLRTSWYEIVDSGLYKHYLEGVHYQKAYGNARSVTYYVSKYVAKGTVTAHEAKEAGWSGRFWGISGRKYLPLDDEREFDLTGGEFVHFRRLARRWLRPTRSGRRYADRIARNAVNYGFELWGLPAEVAEKLLLHAKDLAATTSDESSSPRLANSKLA